ncbi:MAG: type II toxin-antitoxin system RelB/DinJ family antitoxin [Patescibacteria group bacterium]
MKTAVVNVKTDVSTKQKAQKLAAELGLSLGGVINALLRDFVRQRRLDIGLEIPNEATAKALQESEEDYKAGRFHSFKNAKDAIAFLDDISKHGYAAD